MPLKNSDTTHIIEEKDEYEAKRYAEYLYEAKDDIVKKYNLHEIEERLTEALNYNLLHGELMGLKMLLPAYKELVKQKDLQEHQLKSVHILGWCVELMIRTFMINDDIMDKSTMRYGRPCWYTMENIGMSAVNDCIIFENLCYHLLAKHFRNTEFYVDMMEMFHEVMLITSCGQCMDMVAGQRPMASFTKNAYRHLTHVKTAHCALYMPFASAMYLAGIKNPLAFRQIKSICLEMGYFSQAQNDVFDCFVNEKETGNIGTDIEENKLSWLAVECMLRATDDQKRIIEECYGKKDPVKVQQVIKLYHDLQLLEVYRDFEVESLKNIETQLQQATHEVPRKAVLEVLNRIRKRDIVKYV
ncbi:farnesyl pyrophosphate synthase [Stomoxys calcitrans]|uniref:farnesyl pyrophosphate synthase n=1 Tax=Stomoxys calcitrans TaxID=35570 RepID=UPI0027E2EC46|nr:farnesyl pyrophosphate synthase [Stomoxys calcitrans]